MRRILIAVVLAGCTTQVPYKPTTGVTQVPDAHRRAMLVLSDAGKTIETNDPDNGILVTAWEELNGVIRYRFRVSIEPGGAYEVVVLCEEANTKFGGGKTWEACGGDFGKVRPDYHMKVAADIAARLRE
jgi:hypothetical protein